MILVDELFDTAPFTSSSTPRALAPALGALQVSSRELLEAEADRDSLPGAYPARLRLRTQRVAR